MNSKLFVLSVTLLLFGQHVSSQIHYYTTTHLNIGFGKNTDCDGSKYMDFCVNGPLVQPDGSTVGGYVDNGITKKDWVPLSDSIGANFCVANGIFGLGMDGKLYMVPLESKTTLPAMKWAFQNGPILVQNKQNKRGTSVQKFERSGIGYKEDGTIVVIVSFKPLTLREFAELFVEKQCVSAMYLDGGPYVGFCNKDVKYGLVAGATKLQFFNN